MKLAEYASFDGLGLAELVKQGEVTAKELALLAFQAIEQLNPKINAVIETYRDRIDQLDEASLGGGPLRGVPFLIKDVGGLEQGRKTEWGSRLCEGYTPEQDAFFTQLLRQSGVNNLGRTNVPEFCIACTTENTLYGNSSTPWKAGYSAGGSSGGAAAAVSAGIVPIAHGSDIGGSIRIPASWCGGVGLKPSRGRVSSGPSVAEGGFGMSQNLVQTRTVRDTAVMLDCLGVPQPGDPFVIHQPSPPYLQEVDRAATPLRIAYSTQPLAPAPVDPEVAAAVEQTARHLEAMGHHITEAAPPYDFEEMTQAYIDCWFFGYDQLFDQFAEKMGRNIGPDTLEPMTLAIYQASKAMDPYAFLTAQESFNRLRRLWGEFWQHYDIWLSPTTARVSEPHGRYHQSPADCNMSVLEWMAYIDYPVQYTVPYNITGAPAISLPLAMHSQGLPIGIQLGAPHGEEARLIQLASALEQAMPWCDRLPPLHVSNIKDL